MTKKRRQPLLACSWHVHHRTTAITTGCVVHRTIYNNAVNTEHRQAAIALLFCYLNYLLLLLLLQVASVGCYSLAFY
jgi:hypothetical protein